jgi:hypothetical protein
LRAQRPRQRTHRHPRCKEGISLFRLSSARSFSANPDKTPATQSKHSAQVQNRAAVILCSLLFSRFPKTERVKVTHIAPIAQDLQFSAPTHTIRNRNRPAKQVGGQRRLNQHSLNRGSTRQSVLCAVSASPECLMNRGELHRLRTGSPAHCSRPSGSASTFRLP